MWTNTGGSTQTAYLAIDHVRGISNALLRVVFITDYPFSSPVYPSLTLSGPTIWGHTAAADVLSVGATYVGNPTTAEFFTSKGGALPFYFDTSGNALPFVQQRAKPDVAAPDGCQVSNPAFDQALYSGKPAGFFGTSAATPHVAAAAALAWAAQPGLTSAGLINAVRGTATPITSPSGVGNLLGWGLVAAYPLAGPYITSVSTTAS